jgi:uncharacterized protein (TIGR02118 family)
MVVVSVMYPDKPGMRFDERYYIERHGGLLQERWAALGLREVKLLRGVGAPGGGGAATYRVTALLTFESQAALERCLSAHGAEILGDIPNFTDVQPVIQVNEVMG